METIWLIGTRRSELKPMENESGTLTRLFETRWTTLNHQSTFKNVGNHWNTLKRWRTLEHLRTPWVVWKRVQIPWAHWDIWKHEEKSNWNVMGHVEASKHTEASWSTLKRMETHWSIPKHIGNLETPKRYSSTSRPLGTHCNLKHFEACQQTLRHMDTYQKNLQTQWNSLKQTTNIFTRIDIHQQALGRCSPLEHVETHRDTCRSIETYWNIFKHSVKPTTHSSTSELIEN